MNRVILDYTGDMSGTESFADWLASLMEERAIKREDVMSATGASQPTVSRWLSGGRPELRYCLEISRSFQVPLIDVLWLAGYSVDGVPEFEQERRGERAILSPSIELAAKQIERLQPGQRRLILGLMEEFAKADAPSGRES